MKKLSILISAAIISSSMIVASAPALANLPVSLDGQSMPSLAPMLAKATPAVVSIAVKGTHKVEQNVPDAFKFFFGQRGQNQPQKRPFKGLGSGVIIDSDKGYIVTNHHVINNADEIIITLKDGRQFEAKKLGADKESDIALLQVEANNLTEIALSDSDALLVGDFAIAIGSPFGLGQTVTSGIVSALGRSNLNIEQFEDFIQTDAAINSGNSGGALVNLRGELIGINTAILGPNGGNVGIGFAIPSNMMHNLVQQIIEFGEVRRGILGVKGQSVNGEIAKAMELETSQGAFIGQVIANSAAAEAGLKAGDVIIKINGKSVKTFSELRGKIGSIGAEQEVDLVIIRDGDEEEFTVKLKQSQGNNIAAASIHRMLEGAKLKNSDENKGILIEHVAERSPAQMIGLEKGDIITGVNRTRTTSIVKLREYLQDKKGVIALNIIRDNQRQFIMIR